MLFDNVYAPCIRYERRLLWDRLRDLFVQKQGCWLLACDFNTVKDSHEKVGKFLDKGSIANFSNFIKDLQLTDLQMGGQRYGWYKSNGEAMSRLDYFLISPDMLRVLTTTYRLV